MNDKTKYRLQRYWEKLGPYILTAIFSLILFHYQDSKLITHIFNASKNSHFLEIILTTQSIIFGFLITALSITTQSQSKAMKIIHKYKREKELIEYNMSPIRISLVTIVFTIFLLLINADKEINYYDNLHSIWVSLNILCLMLSFRYLKIFCSII